MTLSLPPLGSKTSWQELLISGELSKKIFLQHILVFWIPQTLAWGAESQDGFLEWTAATWPLSSEGCRDPQENKWYPQGSFCSLISYGLADDISCNKV